MTQIISKKYKKLLTVIPLACVLSTSMLAATTFTPTTTYAAASDNTNIIKNGKFIQLSSEENTSNYYPQPSNNPYIEPEQSLLVQTTYVDAKPSDYLILATDGPFQIGIYNNQFYANQGLAGGQLDQLMNVPKNILEGTKLKEEIIWERIYNQLQPKSTTNNWSVQETHGVERTNTQEFGFSVGANISKSIVALQGAFEAKFSTSIAVTDSKTTTIENSFPAKPASYTYNDYRVAIYQKTIRHSIVPGQALKNYINKIDAYKNIQNKPELNITVYKDNEFRPIVTPDNVIKKPGNGSGGGVTPPPPGDGEIHI